MEIYFSITMKNLKIIYASLLIGLVLFGGFFVILANPNGGLPKESSGIVLAVSIFLLPVAWYIPLLIAKKKLIQGDLNVKEKFVSYSQSKILSVIFLDAAYTINGVLYFVTSDRIHWIGMGVFFVAMLLLFPRGKEFSNLYKSPEIPV